MNTMKWKRHVRIVSVLAFVLTVASLYWPNAVSAYQAAYPVDPVLTHALADCGRMNSQFNRFWAADRTACYEGHRLALSSRSGG
jgi:hypothetical protein